MFGEIRSVSACQIGFIYTEYHNRYSLNEITCNESLFAAVLAVESVSILLDFI